MTPKESFDVIRISRSANDKLSEIAQRNHLSKSKAATRIITHYYSNKLSVDLPSLEDYKNLASAIESGNVRLLKMTGAMERTESFIKGLLRDDRMITSPNLEVGISEVDADRGASSRDPRLPEALSLLDQLLCAASQILAVDGRSVMQIRLQMQQFQQLKSQYEKLCM